MQVLELVLYGHNGEKRTLPFSLGKMNIITGKSKSGKSAVGDIIEYCLGGSKCNVADGVVRDSVAWYGLLLQFDDTRIFVARKNPDPGAQSTSLCYYDVGNELQSPEHADFQINTNVDGIEKLLSEHLGITENEHIPEDNESRRALQANIRHALFYCFQSQDEIAARSTLFHRQAEDSFITQAIKDTLPFFLGAVNDEVISLATERRTLERELRILQRKESENAAIVGVGTERAVALLSEAIAVGLIGDASAVDKNSFDDVRDALESIELMTERVPEGSMDRLSTLQLMLSEKEQELSELQAHIYDVKSYMADASGYNDELTHQKVRLESIGLFEKLSFETGVCPLCSGVLDPEPPGVEMLKKSIETLDRSIATVEKERPQLRRHLDKQEEVAQKLKDEIRILQAEISGVYEQIDDARKIRNLNDRRAKVYGRISYWLESADNISTDFNNENRIEEIKSRIKEIDNALDNETVKDRTDSALSIISKYMTEWAKDLDMEYAESPYRLDLGRATVVCDRLRPVVLREMGSASNWLGAHLITMFALHRYFIEGERPVPGFLFLDQPSQVYFPEGSVNDEDMDIQAVTETYEFINRRIQESDGKMQVIIVDHAKLDTEVFRNATIEDWRDQNNNLIPVEWYS